MKTVIEVRSFQKANFCCSIHDTVREIFSLQICCIIWIALPKGTVIRKVEDTKSEGQSEEKGQKDKGNQKKKDKRTNNDLQDTAQKTKDRATQTPLTI